MNVRLLLDLHTCASASDTTGCRALREVLEALPWEQLGGSSCTAFDAQVPRKVDEMWSRLVQAAIAH